MRENMRNLVQVTLEWFLYIDLKPD